MTRTTGSRHRVVVCASLLTVLASAAACRGTVMDSGIERPPQQEFGFGPRTSAAGTYRASVRPPQPIRVGQLHTWTLDVQDRAGSPVTAAVITVDGGMPEHGHGLPTQPRVTRELGAGAYEIGGMKFNMRGWWVVTFHIASPAGTDSVTFNLAL